MMLATIFAFAPNEQPRGINRVPPGGKDSIIICDKFTPMKSEKDSIPHSTYNPSARFHRDTNAVGLLIHHTHYVPSAVAICRTARKKVVNFPKAGISNILNHEVPQIIPHRGRAHIPGRQTFTLA